MTRPGLTPLDDALAELLAHALPLAGIETVSTFDADGRVLAQDCVSALQVPPQDMPEPTLRPVLDLNDPDAIARWLADNGHRFDYDPEMYA